MPGINRAERLQPSLLDRLTDLAPERRQESLDQQVLTIAQLRRAVLRDLGWLLNACNLEAVEDLPSSPLAARSTLNFGVGAIAGAEAGAERLAGIERMVAEAIRAFEPRIRPGSLRVQALPPGREEGLPRVVLEITGELWAQPLPQELFLRTSIELETRLALVSEAGQG